MTVTVNISIEIVFENCSVGTEFSKTFKYKTHSNEFLGSVLHANVSPIIATGIFRYNGQRLKNFQIPIHLVYLATTVYIILINIYTVLNNVRLLLLQHTLVPFLLV